MKVVWCYVSYGAQHHSCRRAAPQLQERSTTVAGAQYHSCRSAAPQLQERSTTVAEAQYQSCSSASPQLRKPLLKVSARCRSVWLTSAASWWLRTEQALMQKEPGCIAVTEYSVLHPCCTRVALTAAVLHLLQTCCPYCSRVVLTAAVLPLLQQCCPYCRRVALTAAVLSLLQTCGTHLSRIPV